MSKREHSKLRALQKMVKKTFRQEPIPTGAQIHKAQLDYLLSKLDSTSISPDILSQYDDLIEEKLKQYEPQELIQRLLNLLCGTMLKAYQNAPDLNKKSREQRKSKDSRSRKRKDKPGSKKRDESRKERNFSGTTTQCKINVGQSHGLNPHRLMGLVNECFTGPKPHFGKISIKKNTTIFDLDSKAVEQATQKIRRKKFSGEELEIKIIDKS